MKGSVVSVKLSVLYSFLSFAMFYSTEVL